MTEYESNDLEAENYEEEEQVYENNNNNNKQEEYNNNNNIENEEEENENENESENNNNITSNDGGSISKINKSKKSKKTKSHYTENTLSQNNNKNNTLSKKTEDNDENENEDNPDILYEEFFNYFLPNKKNTLNIKECKNAMRCLGLVVTEKEIQQYLDIKVKTGKEKINLEEFKYICNKKLAESGNNITELEEAFELMDPEKTGIVDSGILRHQMKVFKPKITEEEINQILSEFSEDENGNINYRDYIKNLKI